MLSCTVWTVTPGWTASMRSRPVCSSKPSRARSVITDLALLGFDPESGRLRLDALQPGATVETVVESTGFELLVSDTVRELDPPTPRELDELRHLHGSDSQGPARLEEVTATT